MSTVPRPVGIALGAAVGVAGLIAPLLLSASDLTIYVLLGTAAMVTVGVSLLMGYAGQVSLGQAAFYAIGGYTAALFAVHGLPRLLGLLLAPVVAGGIAAIIGIPILRLRGHYLAFATLAVQLILLAIVGQVSFFGGDIGLQGIPQFGVGGQDLTTPRAYAWLTWAGVAVVLIITRNIISSRPGRALRALSTSEIAAASSGVPVARYKLAVFALSAGFAGLAGAIYAFFIGYISPGSFPVLLSFEFVVMAVVGGLGTIWGPLVGATVITVVVQVLNDLGTQPGMPSYASSVFSYAVYALLLIVILLFLPRGLLPAGRDLLARALQRFGMRPSAGPDADGAAKAPGVASGDDQWAASCQVRPTPTDTSSGTSSG